MKTSSSSSNTNTTPTSSSTPTQSLYNLDFYQALKEMMENGACIKGEDFAPGYFLKSNTNGNIVLVNANKIYTSEPFSIYSALTKYKFRTLIVMTLKELSK